MPFFRLRRSPVTLGWKIDFALSSAVWLKNISRCRYRNLVRQDTNVYERLVLIFPEVLSAFILKLNWRRRQLQCQAGPICHWPHQRPPRSNDCVGIVHDSPGGWDTLSGTNITGAKCHHLKPSSCWEMTGPCIHTRWCQVSSPLTQNLHAFVCLFDCELTYTSGGRTPPWCLCRQRPLGGSWLVYSSDIWQHAESGGWPSSCLNRGGRANINIRGGDTDGLTRVFSVHLLCVPTYLSNRDDIYHEWFFWSGSQVTDVLLAAVEGPL